ncbi:PREDICTED: uncharacterized protein LOC106743524 isoform X1 [Dinoponera quadriceps]|uniref:Uncharacterized protein LOC106743524 isoform X1 n=1 Tax=Dinoponera quadriceps TaxID=609295 RepID=A0A6P3X3W3_DINQU|nr:PREDICTED: uncharacterized protein LOC106743524 isoform X1 [Dinoponera quadriceps]
MCDVKPMSNDDANGGYIRTSGQRYPVVGGECKSDQQFLAEGMETEASEMLEAATHDGSFGERKQISAEGEAERKTHTLIPSKTKGRKRAFSLLDTLISLSIVGPLAIGFWRGIWTWMDLHADLFPDWFCFASGVFLHVIFAFYQDRCHDVYMDEWTKSSALGRLPYRALRILYTYVFGVACNAHWRGCWIIISDYYLMHIWITTCLMCLLLACLAILRCVRNLIAPPLLIFIDTPAHVFQFPTRYNANTRDWSLYLLDCAFSVGVVGTLVVFVWRGVWILFDLYLFPENPGYSAVGSLAIGYSIVAVTFCLQPLMRYVCARLQGLVRLVVADAFLLLSFLGTVNVWRGIWIALDLWLLPDNPELSCWITHIGCFVFLVLLNCSNSILVRGVYIDAEEEEGKCVVFPCHYLRLFFKIEREKKEARRQKLLVASRDFDGHVDVNGKDSDNGTLLPNNTTVTIIPMSADSSVA